MTNFCLTASVNELCGGRVSEMLYDNIATKAFGASLIEKVKVNGAEAVTKLIKKAQAAPPAGPPGGDMGAPPPGGDPGAGAHQMPVLQPKMQVSQVIQSKALWN